MDSVRLPHIEIDLVRQEIRRPDHPPIALTVNEKALLDALIQRAGQTVSRAELLRALGYKAHLSTRALANAMLRLRRKIELDARDPQHLKTVYGFGYRLELPADVRPAVDDGPVSAVSTVHCVGREDALRQLSTALSPGALVTVLGPAGVGKTTLAQRFIEHRSGAFFIELAEVFDESGVLRAVSRAFAVTPGSERSLHAQHERIQRALVSHGSVFVVLDNTEQISDAVAQMVRRWAAAAPKARWLITSRAPLRLAQEQTLRLGPLLEADAIALFCARAPHIDPADPILPAVVHRLDGLPLAIELAAARCDLLTLTQLHKRLSQRFSVLRSRRRDLPDRQATMDAAIRWSWSLLDAEEQTAMCWLSVFDGPFSLDVAEALLPEPLDAFELVTVLAERSLLSVRWDAEQPQFRTLLSVRAFGRAQRNADLRARTEDRHAEVFLARAERAAATMHRGQLQDAQATLRAIESELLAIHRRFLVQQPERAARAALALNAHWLDRVGYDDHVAMLDEILQQPMPKTERWVRLMAARSQIDVHASRLAESMSRLDEALDVGTMAPLTRAMLLRYRGNAAVRLAQPAAARADYLRALEIALAQQDAWHEGMIRFEMAVAHHYAGRIDDAERLALLAQPLLRQTGHQQGEACILQLFGRLALARDELALALDYIKQEQALWVLLDSQVSIADSQVRIASLLLSRHDPKTRVVRDTFDPVTALDNLNQAATTLAGDGWSFLEAIIDINRGAAALFLARLKDAQVYFERAEEILIKLPAHWMRGLARILRAVTAARIGQVQRAAAYLRQGLLLLDALPRPYAEVIRMLAHAAVGPDADVEAALQQCPVDADRRSEAVHLLVGLLLGAREQ
ncbi:MAG: winged helix-turn-helix domain-containing protein [Myxococcota bacterium]